MGVIAFSIVEVGGGVVLDKLAILHVVSSAHPVDLLVDLSSMMVTLLTSSCHGELDPAGGAMHHPYSDPY